LDTSGQENVVLMAVVNKVAAMVTFLQISMVLKVLGMELKNQKAQDSWLLRNTAQLPGQIFKQNMEFKI
jgi:hypothetical protein